MPFAGQEIIHELVSTVARCFYDDQTILVLEFLKHKTRAREDELKDYLCIQTREVHRICGRLREEKLLRSEKRLEPRKQDQAQMQRTYYHLDFKLFVDVVKWRVWKLQKIVQERVKERPSNKDYICPSCDASYSIMEALSLMDPSGLFKCEVCGSELRDNKSAHQSIASENLLLTMSQQCKRIIDLLRETDKIILPLPIPLDKVPPPDYDGDDFAGFNAKSSKQANGKDIAIAGDSGIRTGEIEIEFGPDISSKEAAKMREQEVDRKRKQNALPPWHIWSTVSYTQMVPDEKIVPAARREHEKRFPNLYKSSTYSGAGDNGRVAHGSSASAMGPKAHSAPHTLDLTQSEDTDEDIREQYFSDYYNIYAKKTGIDIKPNAKGHFFSVLDQFRRHEEIESEAWELEKEYLARLNPDSPVMLKRDSSYRPKNSEAARKLEQVRKGRKRLFDFLDPDLKNDPFPKSDKRITAEAGNGSSNVDMASQQQSASVTG